MDGEQRIKRAYRSILDHDFEKAIEWFESAIRQEPENAEYHHKLSITYARSGKLEKALTHARMACELDPGSQTYTFHLQTLRSLQLVQTAERMLEHQVDPRKAAACLYEAIALDPLCLEAHLLLGVAYAKQSAYSKAADAMREVLKLDPGHEAAQKLLIKYENEQH